VTNELIRKLSIDQYIWSLPSDQSMPKLALDKYCYKVTGKIGKRRNYDISISWCWWCLKDIN